MGWPLGVIFARRLHGGADLATEYGVAKLTQRSSWLAWRS